MSIMKKLAGETVYYGISSILGRILHFLVLTPFYTEVFTGDEYGLVGELFTYSAFLMILFSFRMETTFFRFGSDKGQFDKTFSTASLFLIVSTVCFVAFFFGFSEIIAESMELAGMDIYVKLLVGIIALDTLSAIPFAKLRLENRPRKFAFLKVMNVVINLSVVLFFLALAPKLNSPWLNSILELLDPIGNGVVFVFWSGLIASAFMVLLLLGEYRKLNWVFDFSLWKNMLSYTFPLILVGFCAIFNKEGGLLLIKYLSPGTIEENRFNEGIFNANAKLAVIMSLFTQAYNYAIEPFFFNNKNRKDNRQLYADSTRMYTIVTAIGFVAIMAFLPLLKFLISNEELHVGLGMVPYLLFAYILLGIYYNFSVWFKLTDRTRFGAYIAFIGALVTLGVAAFTVPFERFSYYGVAYAAVACYLVMVISSYLFGKKYYPVPYRIDRMALILILAVGFNGIRHLIMSGFELSFLMQLIIGGLLTLVYISLLLFMEKNFLKRVLRK